LGDLRAGDEVALGPDEEEEQLERFAFEAEGQAVAEEFESAGVEPEVAKLEELGGHGPTSVGLGRG